MICISEDELTIIQDILKNHAPECEARVFGSRYKWTSSDYSDLDLALIEKTKLGVSRLDRIRNAFEESDLPFRVDVRDWHCLTEEFQAGINRGYEAIYTPNIRKKDQWHKIRLGEAVRLHCGKALQAAQREHGDVPVFSSAGLIGQHNHALVESAGVIVGRKGGIGAVYYSAIPFFCLDTAYYITPDASYDLRYVFYLLTYLNLKTLRKDGATPSLHRQTVYATECLFPPLPDQRAIAAALSCLDDKIALNNRINANLESQARAVFRNWFADCALFKDGTFAGSELGRIPKGCKTVRLTDIADVCNGLPMRKQRPSATEVLIPDDKSYAERASIMQPIIDAISVNKEQSRTLAAVRDALLPKLISGELETWE
jgi:type I restriction enzyme S subunit